MYERQMWWKIVLVAAIAGLGYQVTFPMAEKLKFGIDLYGGYSLLYEIDDSGLDIEQKRTIGEQVMKVLQERVDPEGVLNLVWRPVGTNRLEIQMPRPSDAVLQFRAEYDQLRAELRAGNLKRGEVVATISRPAAERGAAIEALVRGVESRRPALLELAELRDRITAGRAATQSTQSVDELANAEEQFESKLELLLAQNIDFGQIQALLDAPPKSKFRKDELERITTATPERAESVRKLVAAYDAWRARRGREGTLDDPADLERLLRGAGVLEFRMLAEVDPANPTQFDSYRDNLKRFGPRPRPGEESFQWFEIEKPRDFFKHTPDMLTQFDQRKLQERYVVERYGDKYYVLAYVTTNKALTHRPGEPEWSLKGARPSRDEQGKPAVEFQLDELGGARFDQLTRQNKGKLLAIFLDDKAVSYATIQSAIRTSGIIHGSFTVKEVQELVKKLNAGSLPRKLKEPPISVRAIGPSLGEANRKAGMRSAYIGAAAVVAFMLIFYLYAGMIAIFALVLNVLLTMAVLATLGATLTLPGIAGLVLSIGMAVDANVLINERIREEENRGAGIRTAIRLGYERAFSAIIDSNLTTLMTSLILYWIASEEIKGFGLTLAAGVVLNLLTAVFVTRLFFEFMTMPRIPTELVRNPLVAAAGPGVVGALLWGVAWKFIEPDARTQSVTLALGHLLAYMAIAVLLILVLMFIGRTIHRTVQPAANARIPMLRLIGVPSIDWYGMRRLFYGVSAVMALGGAALFFTSDPKQLYDIEFLGGTAAQIDLKTAGSANESELTKRLEKGADELRQIADAIETRATVSGKAGEFQVMIPGTPANRVADLVRGMMGDALAPNGVREVGTDQLRLLTKAELNLTDASIKDELKRVARQTRAWAADLADAQVQAVSTLEPGAISNASFEIVSRLTSKEVVVSALLSCMGDLVDIPREVSFQLGRNRRLGDVEFFPIGDSDLSTVTGDLTLADGSRPAGDVGQWRGGVAIIVDRIDPPQTLASLDKRLRGMRLQPGFEQYGWRDSEVLGLARAGAGDTFSAVAILVSDENFPFEEMAETSDAWRSNLAEPEVKLVREALERQTSLAKITQFAPQVAAESKQKAYIALALAWLAIVIYLWFRFGKASWGAAAVLALIHDVLVALGMVAISRYLASTAIGQWLLIEPFRIDLAMVAALLTVIGYSVNDTIVVFDRMRENRGRAGVLRPSLINNSINQTLSRTILTVLTVLLVVVIMYIFGGRGIHGFMFAMFVGTLSGSYSSIFVASPLLAALEARVSGSATRTKTPQPVA